MELIGTILFILIVATSIILWIADVLSGPNDGGTYTPDRKLNDRNECSECNGKGTTYRYLNSQDGWGQARCLQCGGLGR